MTDEIWVNDGKKVYRTTGFGDKSGDYELVCTVKSKKEINLVKAAPRLLHMCEIMLMTHEDNVLLRQVIEFAKIGRTK